MDSGVSEDEIKRNDYTTAEYTSPTATVNRRFEILIVKSEEEVAKVKDAPEKEEKFKTIEELPYEVLKESKEVRTTILSKRILNSF